MPARKPRSSGGPQTITLEQYRAALAAKDLDALRRTGTDMSAHVSQPASQECSTGTPCDGVNQCSRHRPKSTGK